MSFLNQVIETTKESNKKYKLERAEYERASNVLYDIAERKLKKCVLQRANAGYTDATFDVINDLKLDIAGKWSIPELLFAIIFEDAPPVVSRLFYLSNSPFDGFAISTKDKGAGPPSVFVIDWAYAMLKPQTQPAPVKPEPAPKPAPKPSPKPAPKPAPPANIEAVYYSLPPVSNWDMGMFNTEESILGTPPTKPREQTPPGAPVKPNNPVVRNIFEDRPLPMLTDQQLIDYLTSIYHQ